jgi:hypothetical protein
MGGYMRSLIFALFLLLPSASFAQYAEVANMPTIEVGPRVLKIWATQSMAGDFIGVFERDQDGKWYGLCTTAPEWPDLSAKIANGASAYIDSQLPVLNACLKSKFGGTIDASTLGQINTALRDLFRFQLTNNAPALARR